MQLHFATTLHFFCCVLQLVSDCLSFSAIGSTRLYTCDHVIPYSGRRFQVGLPHFTVIATHYWVSRLAIWVVTESFSRGSLITSYTKKFLRPIKQQLVQCDISDKSFIPAAHPNSETRHRLPVIVLPDFLLRSSDFRFPSPVFTPAPWPFVDWPFVSEGKNIPIRWACELFWTSRYAFRHTVGVSWPQSYQPPPCFQDRFDNSDSNLDNPSPNHPSWLRYLFQQNFQWFAYPISKARRLYRPHITVAIIGVAIVDLTNASLWLSSPKLSVHTYSSKLVHKISTLRIKTVGQSITSVSPYNYSSFTCRIARRFWRLSYRRFNSHIQARSAMLRYLAEGYTNHLLWVSLSLRVTRVSIRRKLAQPSTRLRRNPVLLSVRFTLTLFFRPFLDYKFICQSHTSYHVVPDTATHTAFLDSM